MKACPFCAETIQDAAKVCKHCQRDLPPGQPRVTSKDQRLVFLLRIVGVGLMVIFVGAVIGAAIYPSSATPAALPTSTSAQAQAPIVAPAAVHDDPLGLTIRPNGLTIENRTGGALEQCLVQILGGWAAIVPVIPARTAEFRFFTVLFDSEDHEREAALAGHMWQDFVLSNAKAKTSVSCRNVNGERVAMTFTP